MTVIRRTKAACDASIGTATLWILRALVDCGGLAIARRSDRIDGAIAKAIGHSRLSLEDRGLERRLAKLRDQAASDCASGDATLLANVASLAAQIGLTRAERGVLAVATLAEWNDGLKETIDLFCGTSSVGWHELIATMIGEPAAHVRLALRSDGTLARTALVRLRRRSSLHAPFEVPDHLTSTLAREHASGEAVLASFCRRAPEARLGLDAFAHAHRDVDILRRFLDGAMVAKTVGVNVLLHGAPGTGKTELTRAIAASLDATLYEVSHEDDDGCPLHGTARLGAHAVTQRVLARRERSLVVFDEMEDAFARSTFAHAATENKAWTNRTIEESGVPTMWTTNRIDYLDRSLLRRFDLVMRLDPPPRAARRRILCEHIRSDLVGERWLDRTAADDRLAPALIERAARVAAIAGARVPADAIAILDRVLQSALATQGPSRSVEPAMTGLARYDLSYLNASCSVQGIVDGLRRRPSATACLHGPPGTGKTAFVRYVADALGRPLLARRGSDLLRPHVGETEAAIAEAFATATCEGAILLIDEVDGFLRDRTLARHSWEISQVNEMLVQIEHFGGVLFCATNHLDMLDPAAMRRFALKVRFDPLDAAQRQRLFDEAIAGAADLHEDAALDTKAEIARMAGLTIGDFAAAIRAVEILGDIATPTRLADALADEWRSKPSAARRSIGFGCDDRTRRT